MSFVTSVDHHFNKGDSDGGANLDSSGWYNPIKTVTCSLLPGN